MSDKEKSGRIPLTAEEVTAEKTTFTLADLLSMEVDEVPRLFYPIFVKSGIAVLVGGSDTGKSSLLRQMAMCVATGRDFLTWRYNGERHRAIYLSSEDDATITAAVVKKYNKTMQLPDSAKTNLRFRFDLNSDNVIEGLEQMLSEQAADLIVIDALADFFNGRNLNDNKEVRNFYAPFKEMAKKHNCLIIFNHHTGKRTSAYTPDKDNSLGSQAIEAAPRLAIELRADPHNPDIKHFCAVKGNYLPTEHKTKSFALRMDDNLVFSPTGERTDFAELAKRPNEKRKTAPTDFAAQEHRDFLKSTFDGGQFNQTQLRSAIMQEFEISGKTADKFITYYLHEKWVCEVGKGARGAIVYESRAI